MFSGAAVMVCPGSQSREGLLSDSPCVIPLGQTQKGRVRVDFLQEVLSREIVSCKLS